MFQGLEETWAAILFTGLAMVGGFVVYFYRPYWKLRNIPGPPANFLLGHLLLMIKHGHYLLITLAKEYGPVFKIRVWGQPMVVIANVELCREVAVKNFKNFSDRAVPLYFLTSPLHKKTIFSSRGAKWSALRNAIVAAYQPTALASCIPTIKYYIDAAIRNISATNGDQDINFSQLLTKLSTDVIAKTSLGVDLGLLTEDKEGTDEEKELSRRFLKAYERSTYASQMLVPHAFSTAIALFLPILELPTRAILERLPWTADYEVRQSNTLVSKTVNAIVEMRAKELDKGKTDFISTLLRVGESDGPKRELFTRDYVIALGYENMLRSAEAMTFTLSTVLYAVSERPEVEKKLLKEIDGFGPHDRVPTADDLQQKFPYLTQVLSETMRLYPSSPLVTREAAKDFEVGGYVLPKGTWVWLALDVLAKDPKNFPEPQEFRPERFDPNSEEYKRRPPYAFLPFGCGPRACTGQKLAMQEIKLSLIELYRKFTFALSPNMKTPVEFVYGGILLNFSHDLKLRATRRSV